MASGRDRPRVNRLLRFGGLTIGDGYIASVQQGLFEQLAAEAQSLAGGNRDGAQRAVVYHHLADSLGLNHVHALLAAQSALALEPAIARIEQAARRARWRLNGRERDALQARAAAFGGKLRDLDRQRCAAMLLAYRMIARPGLGDAARRIDPELEAAMVGVRANPGAAARRALFLAQQKAVEALIGGDLEAAIAELDWSLSPRPVKAAIALLRIPLSSFELAERRGLARVARQLRADKALPEKFARNPAQAFYTLQRQLAERRRRRAEFADLPPEEAVRLAA